MTPSISTSNMTELSEAGKSVQNKQKKKTNLEKKMLHTQMKQLLFFHSMPDKIKKKENPVFFCTKVNSDECWDVNTCDFFVHYLIRLENTILVKRKIERKL